MQRTLALAAVAALGAMAAGTAANAADFGRRAPVVPVYPAYVPAHYVVVPQISYRCARWTERCDRRWGMGSPRFARCMWRHGC